MKEGHPAATAHISSLCTIVLDHLTHTDSYIFLAAIKCLQNMSWYNTGQVTTSEAFEQWTHSLHVLQKMDCKLLLSCQVSYLYTTTLHLDMSQIIDVLVKECLNTRRKADDRAKVGEALVGVFKVANEVICSWSWIIFRILPQKIKTIRNLCHNFT